eukprot:c17924_g1_i3.p1 GENE.c17924_g1_i3~~c17924_g1_i3.p1  ORF type:complete len:989 (+),score=232.05 c17924_g1_i3:441-2969(+)
MASEDDDDDQGPRIEPRNLLTSRSMNERDSVRKPNKPERYKKPGKFRKSLRTTTSSEMVPRTMKGKIRHYLLSPTQIHTGVFVVLLGIIGGSVLFAIDYTVFYISIGQGMLFNLFDDLPLKMAVYFASQVLLAGIAVLATHKISGAAAGGGISEVKSILSGITLPGFLGRKAIIAKIIGIICMDSSGLYLGKHGAYVHITCGLAKGLMKLKPFRYLEESKMLCLQILAVASTVGVAGSFGAPVGAVLFSIEVTSTHFLTSNYFKCFLGAISCTVTMRLWSLSLGRASDFTPLFSTNFGSRPFDRLEVFVFAILGIVCGFLGAAFVALAKAYALFRRKHPHFLGRNRYIHLLSVCAITTIVCFPFAEFLRATLRQNIKDLIVINDLKADPNLVATDWNSKFGVLVNLCILLVVKTIITLFCNGVSAPTGVFTPVFVLGAAVGRLFGEAMAMRYPNGFDGKTHINAAGYALVGAAALTSGATHAISTAIIVFELTGELRHAIPTLVASMLAISVGRALTPSAYDLVLLLRNLPYLSLPQDPNNYQLTASQVMDNKFPYIANRATATEIAQALKKWPLVPCFAVVDNNINMLFLGNVKRKALEYILKRLLIHHIIKARQNQGNLKGQYALSQLEKAQASGLKLDLNDILSHKAPVTEVTPVFEQTHDPTGEIFSAPQRPDEDNSTPGLAEAESELQAQLEKVVAQSLETEEAPKVPETEADLPVDAPASTAQDSPPLTPEPTQPSSSSAPPALSSPPTPGPKTEVAADVADIPSRVIQLQLDARINFLSKYAWLTDASPYQVVAEAPLSKVYHMLTMLEVDRLYVTNMGHLVGDITVAHLVSQRL